MHRTCPAGIPQDFPQAANVGVEEQWCDKLTAKHKLREFILGAASLQRNGSDFSAYHFVYYFLWSLSCSKRFGSDVFCGKIVYKHHFKTLVSAIIVGSNPTHSGIYFGENAMVSDTVLSSLKQNC